jgi:hypothetical protein
VLFCCFSSPDSNACYQAAPVPIHINANSLNGRATRDDNPSKSVHLKLYRAITFNRAEGKKLWESPPVKTAITASDGSFSFGEVEPGRYWLIVEGGVLGGFPVEVKALGPEQSYKRLWYNYFADGCESLSVEDAH